jgi:hypothetical protein
MRIAGAVTLSPEQKQALERMARARSLPAQVVERARVVLMAAEGLENKEIAGRMNMTPEKAARWAEPLSGRRHRSSGKGCAATGLHAHHHRAEGKASGGYDAAQQAGQPTAADASSFSARRYFMPIA